MPEPSELATTPNVIPYVEPHSGPRRMLTLEITTPVRPPVLSGLATAPVLFVPFAGIDGRQYVVPWGSVSFEIPADRNVHVSVHLASNGGGETALLSPFASIVLYPGPNPERLVTQFNSPGLGALVPLR
jgi:hypothetical protein